MSDATGLGPGSALLVIDVQNDFCPGGALAVPGGDAILPAINALIGAADLVVLTQDWHPRRHGSFASVHKGRAPFETITVAYGPQTLWPDHCVQGTSGAAFHEELLTDRAALVVRKGMRPTVDSYSAFFENDRVTTTGLDGWLRSRGVSRVVCCGLAFDYCVAYSALDAQRLGFSVAVVEDACAAIDLDGSRAAQAAAMQAAGVALTTAAALGV
ncbi:bifunctional nicotinamidase/pyrazinamidase [Vineibacter terrae]|uniref:bifunctional nicotinamidase/pyrazinamidase n=1 Tax=Vineibacter terrae TaxID=2586908 RepID=UPI002E31D830|nr:bifunctional nicotinamidase/pyrazinamidase [Vineibacter terrae]HEX2886291.1 bifunctional nicotinamidase/pyrazinamidase [Vineibacter terrae]